MCEHVYQEKSDIIWNIQLETQTMLSILDNWRELIKGHAGMYAQKLQTQNLSLKWDKETSTNTPFWKCVTQWRAREHNTLGYRLWSCRLCWTKSIPCVKHWSQINHSINRNKDDFWLHHLRPDKQKPYWNSLTTPQKHRCMCVCRRSDLVWALSSFQGDIDLESGVFSR